VSLGRRSHGLLGIVLAAFACEVEDDGQSTLDVFVSVAPSVQADTASPAQVLVSFDSGGSGVLVFRVGFLCRPPAVPFATTARFSGVSNDEAVVHASVVPMDGGTPFACGPSPAPERVPSPAGGFAGARVASARADVAVGCGAGGARSATIVIAR
jgi:hypothetical protein